MVLKVRRHSRTGNRGDGAGGTATHGKVITKLKGKIYWGIGREAWLREPVPPEVDKRPL